MIFDILTLFPDFFDGFLRNGVLARAIEKKTVGVNVINLRDFADDKHRTTDDRSFGGGPGMVMMAEPIYRAIKKFVPSRAARTAKKSLSTARARVILLSPQGRRLDHSEALRLSRYDRLFLICGRYEGVDERLSDFIDEEISVGDYVLAGGEVPAMIVVDAVSRFVKGVVKESASVEGDSFYDGLLDYPHYTRPRVWRGRKVPGVLLSGDHKSVEKWRRQKALENTRKKRPDLIENRSKV